MYIYTHIYIYMSWQRCTHNPFLRLITPPLINKSQLRGTGRERLDEFHPFKKPHCFSRGGVLIGGGYQSGEGIIMSLIHACACTHACTCACMGACVGACVPACLNSTINTTVNNIHKD